MKKLKKMVFMLLVIFFLGCGETGDGILNFAEDEGSGENVVIYQDRFGVISNDDRFLESELLPFPNEPTIADETNFKFLMVADMHNKPFTPDPMYAFTVAVGDSSLNGFESEYRTFNFSKFLYALGNHELDNGGWKYWNQYVGYSTHYYFEIGSLCLVVMDTASCCYNAGDFGDLQYEWLENVLENTTCPNIVIATHINTIKLYGQSRLADLCIEYNVKALVTGHTHNYAWELVGDTRCFTLNDYYEGGSGTYLKFFVVNDTLTWQVVL